MLKKIALFVFLLANFVANAQNTQSIVPVIAQGSEYIKLIEEKYKQQIVNIEYDVIQKDREIYREMFADVIYGIIIYGDNNVKDLDLDVLAIDGDDWKIVAKDDQTEGMVMLYFTPKADGMYKLNISAKLFNPTSFGYYGLIMFR